ncbi:MAG TPA: ATP synthase A1 subunit C [Candidatus Thermoplasmatota archaeon]
MQATTVKVPFIGGMLQRSNYAYANARVRVRRGKLLPRDTYQKLLKMDIPEITRFIESTEYGREINELAVKFSGINLLENALNVNEERNYAQVKEFAKGEVGSLVRGFLDRWTFWNLKTVLRGRYWGASPEDIVRELLIENRDDHEFYQALIHAEGTGLKPVVEALAVMPRTASVARTLRDAETKAKDDSFLLQAYEDALDRAYFENLLETIPPNNRENQLFLRFVKHEIDIRNLQLLLRLKSRPDSPSDVGALLLPGGYELKDAALRRLGEAANLDDLLERLKEFKIYDKIKDAVAQSQPAKSLTPIMLALTRSLADFAQTFAVLNPLSVLPIVNYLMRKNLEVRNLRAIARGKQGGLTEQEIENLLVVI